MDTSATMRKATNDKEKEEYRRTGKCFECGEQGYLACVCPTKRNWQTSTNHIIEIEDYEVECGLTEVRTDPEALATRAMKLLEEDRDAFVWKLQELGAETGFLNT